jgi:hypothetical protein
MRPLFIVELKINGQMRSDVRDRLIFVQIDLLLLDRAPKPVDEDVVVHPAPAVLADPDPLGFKAPREP